MTRHDQRDVSELRSISFIPNIAPHATGSVLVSFGNTRVICAATIESKIPRWMKEQEVSGGWVTAEYAMLPYSTLDRKQRDSVRGKQDGRSVEIQRLIGRSLRAGIDLEALGARTLYIDCDVLQADGGTRTASITGASVASFLACQKLVAEKKLQMNPIRKMVGAVSVGIVANTPCLDLDYIEDKDAAVDFNVVMSEAMEFVEIQGTGEEATFSNDQLAQMLDLAKTGLGEIFKLQRDFLNRYAASTESESFPFIG